MTGGGTVSELSTTVTSATSKQSGSSLLVTVRVYTPGILTSTATAVLITAPLASVHW